MIHHLTVGLIKILQQNTYKNDTKNEKWMTPKNKILYLKMTQN